MIDLPDNNRNKKRGGVEFDDDHIIALAEAYLAWMEHPMRARKGPDKN